MILAVPFGDKREALGKSGAEIINVFLSQAEFSYAAFK
jgi:hypothetical protein